MGVLVDPWSDPEKGKRWDCWLVGPHGSRRFYSNPSRDEAIAAALNAWENEQGKLECGENK